MSSFSDGSDLGSILAAALSGRTPTGSLFTGFNSSLSTSGTLSGTGFRSRTDWNNCFAHWQRPATVTEEGTIDRAERNVREALGNSDWLVAQGASLYQQGSYYNNTNVRTEADIDLRLVHPLFKVEYSAEVHQPAAESILTYSDSGMSFGTIFSNLRDETAFHLGQRFGAANVDSSGNKAIRLKGMTGSRAEVDVVPSLVYRHVAWNTVFQRYDTTEGVAISGRDGAWTINFPAQHHANGVAKRQRTAHRFKKMVRIFKRFRSDLPDADQIKAPSFLVECLVYMVEDHHFLFEDDDAYDRVRRIAVRIRQLLTPLSAAGLREVNGIKPLFAQGQAWSRADAVKYVDAVIARLGAA